MLLQLIISSNSHFPDGSLLLALLRIELSSTQISVSATLPSLSTMYHHTNTQSTKRLTHVVSRIHPHNTCKLVNIALCHSVSYFLQISCPCSSCLSEQQAPLISIRAGCPSSSHHQYEPGYKILFPPISVLYDVQNPDGGGFGFARGINMTVL